MNISKAISLVSIYFFTTSASFAQGLCNEILHVSSQDSLQYYATSRITDGRWKSNLRLTGFPTCEVMTIKDKSGKETAGISCESKNLGSVEKSYTEFKNTENKLTQCFSESEYLHVPIPATPASDSTSATDGSGKPTHLMFSQRFGFVLSVHDSKDDIASLSNKPYVGVSILITK